MGSKGRAGNSGVSTERADQAKKEQSSPPSHTRFEKVKRGATTITNRVHTVTAVGAAVATAPTEAVDVEYEDSRYVTV